MAYEAISSDDIFEHIFKLHYFNEYSPLSTTTLENIDSFPENENLKDTKNESLKYTYKENQNNNSISSKFKIEKHKDRGKQSKISRKRKHMSSCFDNLQTKIQVHFLSFIIDISNDALLAEFGVNKCLFKEISYKEKQRVSQDFVQQLKNSPISNVLQMPISKKYKKFDEFSNKATLINVCKSSNWLNDFFNINYLALFNYYYNNEKKLNKITFKGKEIILSKNTKSFYDLLEKNKELQKKLIDTAQIVYFNGYKTLIGKNSFVSIKNEIDLIE